MADKIDAFLDDDVDTFLDAPDVKAEQKETPIKKKSSPLMAAVTGANSLVPSIAGLPIDAMTNIANLGIAGYGAGRDFVGRHLLNEKPWEAASAMPELLPPQVGGSQWMADKINQGLGFVSGKPEDVFSNPRPDSRLAQMLHTGTAVTASGLVNPSAGIRQALGNTARMAPSGVGASVAQQVSDNPLAPALGAMIAPTASSINSTIKSRQQNTVQLETLKNARKSGYVVPPSEANPSLTNTTLESVSGKAATAQTASVKNQKVTNQLIVDDLHESASKLGIELPKKKQLTDAVLKDVREKAGKAYDDVKKHDKMIVTDAEYLKGIQGLAGDFQQAAKEFPDIAKNKQVETLINSLTVKQMSPTAAVELTKKLRFDASKNLRSFDDPEKVSLGLAQRKASDLIERLVESNLEVRGKGDLVQRWRDARTLIAKSHDAESALNNSNGNIDARVFAKLADGGKLTGGFKQVADFATAFPRAVQDPSKFGSPGVSKLQAAASAFLGAGGGLATGGPGAALAAIPFVAPPAARSLMLSKPYQKGLSKGRYETPSGLLPYLSVQDSERLFSEK